jgi:small subunit ribosomal protein S17
VSAEPQPGKSPVYRRRLIGRVRSDKMDKTVVVEVVRFKRDGMYKKYVRVRKRYHAHDEKNEYKVGDRVEIIEYRPLSKHKRWAVTRLLERPAAELFQRTIHPAEGDSES